MKCNVVLGFFFSNQNATSTKSDLRLVRSVKAKWRNVDFIYT